MSPSRFFKMSLELDYYGLKRQQCWLAVSSPRNIQLGRLNLALVQCCHSSVPQTVRLSQWSTNWFLWWIAAAVSPFEKSREPHFSRQECMGEKFTRKGFICSVKWLINKCKPKPSNNMSTFNTFTWSRVHSPEPCVCRFQFTVLSQVCSCLKQLSSLISTSPLVNNAGSWCLLLSHHAP